jgi:type IV secretory pathway protease TraF
MKRKWLFAAVLALLPSGMIGVAQETGRDTTVLIRGVNDALTVSSVLAGPGDMVSLLDGQVVVNGKATDVRVEEAGNWGPRPVDAGVYFVAGDPARLGSNPRAWGLVSHERILGTVNLGKLPSR